jgi:signal transduction histidine kinase
VTSARILIVDDDAALLQALPVALQLRLGSVQVETSDSATTALERIARHDYDTIVSDIKMPGMDGLTLLLRIRELRPDTPTLLITGHGEHDLAVQALRGGAYDFIQKPIDRDYFVASLQRAIQTRQLRRQVEEQSAALARHAERLERAVEERTRELVQANHVKDTFLGIASHELKTPLTSLKGLAQITHRRLAEREQPEAAFLERMERAIGRIETLVNDLVDVSRIDSGKLAFRFACCDLRTLCQQVVDEQEAASERAITLTLPSTPIELDMDADRISQVLTNLISNALKFAPPETPITVTVAEGAEVEEVAVTVRDGGPGIPPEQLPHIFERFYQVPEAEIHAGSKIGLGLGLFISREIVERHGGRIWVESEPGQGSAFSFALPRVRRVVTLERRERSAVQSMPRGS